MLHAMFKGFMVASVVVTLGHEGAPGGSAGRAYTFRR